MQSPIKSPLYYVMSTNYETHFVVFSSVLLLHILQFQHSPQHFVKKEGLSLYSSLRETDLVSYL